MNLESFFNTYATSILFFGAIYMLVKWLFIKSAVEHGTKKALMETYKQILIIENNPTLKEEFIKTNEQLLQEEAEKEYNEW